MQHLHQSIAAIDRRAGARPVVIGCRDIEALPLGMRPAQVYLVFNRAVVL